MNIDIIYSDKEGQRFCFSHASWLTSKGVHIKSEVTINEKQKCMMCEGEISKEDVIDAIQI